MTNALKQIVISKEDAVFWMDEHGSWQNEHGPIEHPRIIKYFNSCIQKDEKGYFVHQKTEKTEEKVYFSFVDTAIFVVGIRFDNDVVLMLNNGETIILDPKRLYSKKDSLFCKTEDHLIKFSIGALIKISKYLSETGKENTSGAQLFFDWDGKSYLVRDFT